jgi:hypothetical protein
MKIYYAHCINIYGTQQEKRDIATLEALGFEVVNPNSPANEEGYKAKGMDYFKEFSISCAAVAFRATATGEIPAGVVKEVTWFLELNKPVIELPTRFLCRSMDVLRTKEFLREVGCR